MFAVANLAGFLLGLVSTRVKRSSCASVGLHLSWAPVVVALILLTAHQPQLAADMIKRLAGLAMAIFNGIADTIELLA